MQYSVNDGPELSEFFEHPVVQQNLNHPLVSLRLLDAAGTYVYASNGVHNLLGYDARALVGHEAWSYAHADDAATAQAMMNEVARGSSVNGALRLRTASGHYRWVETRMAPFKGFVAAFVKPARDGPNFAFWRHTEPFL